jgi:N-acetylmuramoyl-L-alanine amidase
MREIKRIYWHTAAHGNEATGVDYDTTAAQINSWHRDRGWSSIGYHYVIRKNGTIEDGRKEESVPAQVLGDNHNSIGICFSGHGDIKPLTADQLNTGIQLTIKLLRKYNLVNKFLDKPNEVVLGHREVNSLVDKGILSSEFRTSKTCPGTKVDMNKVRTAIKASVSSPTSWTSGTATTLIVEHNAAQDVNIGKSLFEAFQTLYGFFDKDIYLEHLNYLRREAEVTRLIDLYKHSQGI